MGFVAAKKAQISGLCKGESGTTGAAGEDKERPLHNPISKLSLRNKHHRATGLDCERNGKRHENRQDNGQIKTAPLGGAVSIIKIDIFYNY